MRKAFYPLGFLLTVSMTATVFTACDKDEDGKGGTTSVVTDNKLTVKVENGSAYNDQIDSVKIVQNDGVTIAAGKWENGGFTLELPATVADKYLDALDDVPEGVKVSNLNVKIAFTDFGAYQNDVQYQVRVGSLYYTNVDITTADTKTGGTEGIYVYASSDVSITGSSTYDDEDYYYDPETGEATITSIPTTNKFNIFLKKGWNIIYETIKTSATSVTSELTTTKPSGNFKWYYDSYGNYSAAQKKAKTNLF